MSATTLLAACLVGLGAALLAVGILGRFRARTESLAEILDLPYGERDVAVAAVTETRNPLVEDTIGLAARMVTQLDTKGSLLARLERSRLPIRPGELVVLTCGATAVLGLFVAAVTANWIFGVAAAVAVPFGVNGFLGWRIRRRRQALEAQLPEALSIIASSLSAGHTFLRSIQMMCEEAEAPLAEELERVVSETRLGGSVVDALERMAARVDVEDLTWVVQAVRIQQQVGGKLADLLHTLADFLRAREEIRREVDVLTAEGRISAWVLGGLPVLLALAIQVMNPGYLDPMFRGWGITVMAGTAASVVTGMVIIRRMVEIEV